MRRSFLAGIAVAALLAVGVSTSSAQTPLLQYTFDEASSGTTPALDTGAAPPAPGTFGGGAVRTGTTPASASIGALDTTAGNSFVSGGDADKLDGLGPMTLTGWVNLQAAPANGNRVMSKQVASGNFDGFSFAFSNPSSGTIAANNFRLNLGLGGTGGFGFFVSDQNLSADNQWLFVAATYDGTGGVTFYTGGEATPVGSVGGSLLAGAATPGTLVANDREFKVAAQSEGTVSPRGFFDDMRVYGEVLTPAQLETVRLAAIPEPASLSLLALAGVAAMRRQRRD